ncbi:clathrin adaptor complex small chain-domain-containing protein [Lipomyces kononenkoae]|uniref:Clathrin adaptor complex small chain-domain-containing protein n=1 Tax=Lipomyces kononenkoae TaxID=34357 RepID=A0ACC3SXX2_LIPKO
MAVQYVILLSRQGKVRLAKWFLTLSLKEKSKIVKDVSTLVLGRRTKMCNFLEYKESKVVYRRYASLFFIAGIDSTDNELITLEIIHRYVEQMDRYYGNVCELDIIFNFQKAYYILDELLLAGEIQESSKRDVLRRISQQDALEEAEGDEEKFSRLMPYISQIPGLSSYDGSGPLPVPGSGSSSTSFSSARASRVGSGRDVYYG